MNGFQSALAPAGVQASEIHHLWNVFLCVSVVVYVAVLTLAIVAVIHAHKRTEPIAGAASERRAAIFVSSGAALTVVILVALLIASVATGHTIGTLGRTDANHLEIQVTGHEWWWEITYPNREPDKAIKTANEIHIPVGRVIELRLATRDVIHSLWIPNLHGKRDLIPGRVNKFWIEAERPGIYRGQCAEFCGLQHANMSLVVVAESENDFEQWQQHQRTAAPEPSTAAQARGREAFLTLPCINCHAITGIDAYATAGPDLTHVATRATLGAGTLINNKGNLGGWIVNAQALKPGSGMPANEMTPQQLNDLLAYLETLK